VLYQAELLPDRADAVSAGKAGEPYSQAFGCWQGFQREIAYMLRVSFLKRWKSGILTGEQVLVRHVVATNGGMGVGQLRIALLGSRG
jgi:hypothetical protein